MNASTFLILVAIGLVSGILGGVIGLGGGVIMIPAMVMFLAMDQRTAQGTSIAIMLPPIGIMAAYSYYKGGYVNVKYAVIIAIAFMIGGYFGSKLALSVPEQAIRKGFAVLLCFIAAKMFLMKG